MREHLEAAVGRAVWPHGRGPPVRAARALIRAQRGTRRVGARASAGRGRTGATAREHVRVAQALAALPKLSDAMRRGRVSYSKVRAVTRVATPETEQALLDVALAGTAAVDEAAGVVRSLGQRQAEALGRLAECALAGGLDRGTAGDRYQVVLHVDAETLAGDAAADGLEPAAGGPDAHGDVPAGTRRPVRRAAAGCPLPPAARGQAALAEDGGIRVGQETARRIACDAATVTMRHGADGGVLDVGRRTRTVSPALRRALAARDGQCRFPGCAARRCDARTTSGTGPRAGRTALANLVLPCRRHHRAVHEEDFRVRVDAGGATTFLRPDGRPLPEAPAAPAWDGPALAPVDRRLAAEGIGIDADTAPRWQGERLDLGWAIGVLWLPRERPDPDGPRQGLPESALRRP